MVCARGVPRGNEGPSGRPITILTQPKLGRGPHHLVKAAVDLCMEVNLKAIFEELICGTEFENCRKYSIRSRSFSSDTFQENTSEIE